LSRNNVSAGSLLPSDFGIAIVVAFQIIIFESPLGPFTAFNLDLTSFLGPFDASVLDPFISCLDLVSPSFIIERWGLHLPFLPFPCHPFVVSL
jgi:hypothetical protein